MQVRGGMNKGQKKLGGLRVEERGADTQGTLFKRRRGKRVFLTEGRRVIRRAAAADEER